MRRSGSLVLLAVALLASSCGTTEESDRRWLQSTPDSTQQVAAQAFETRTDTVAVRYSKDEPTAGQRGSTARYSVQIGSFRVQRNAARAQSLARQRFQSPVINDYDAGRRLHHIRVGFFSTREEAEAFRARLVAAYPHEYDDAWIVRIIQK